MIQQLFLAVRFLELLNSIVAILLIMKILGSYLFRKKADVDVNRSFWFYVFFAICYALFSITQWHLITVVSHPENITNFQRSFLAFSRNMLYAGAYMYLQVYCYKLVTTCEVTDVYSGKSKATKKKKIVEKSIYVTGLLTVLIQTLSATAYPLFKYLSLTSIELFATVCVLLCLIELCILYKNTNKYKKVLKTLIGFTACGILVLTCTMLIDFFLNHLANGQVFNLMFLTCSVAAFSFLRLTQLVLVLFNIFRTSDVRLLYG